MTIPATEQERLRIAGVYSTMSDEELGQIADSGDELSVAAQEAFQAEVAKRGLKMAIAPPRGEDVFEFNETVTVRQFRDLPDALLAKGSLESAAIQAYMVDVEGVGNCEQPKCPRCQALDVTYMEYKQGWTCGTCGNEWNEPEGVPRKL